MHISRAYRIYQWIHSFFATVETAEVSFIGCFVETQTDHASWKLFLGMLLHGKYHVENQRLTQIIRVNVLTPINSGVATLALSEKPLRPVVITN